MTDPRVQRTRLHVLDTVRTILTRHDGEPITLSSLAKEAEVSRRTLYIHWGTIEQVMHDAIELAATSYDHGRSADHANRREPIGRFLAELRDTLADPVVHVGMAFLIRQASLDTAGSYTLNRLIGTSLIKCRATIGQPVTRNQYFQLVGPIFLAQFIGGQRADDELVESGIGLAATMFGSERHETRN